MNSLMDEYQLGFVVVARKLFTNDEELWRTRGEVGKLLAWLDIINLAAFRGYYRRINGSEIWLQRGEFIASIRWLAKRWDWSNSKAERFIQMNRNMERLVVQRLTPVGSVYRVVKYDDYQLTPDFNETPIGIGDGT